jgi:hypothetical protein
VFYMSCFIRECVLWVSVFCGGVCVLVCHVLWVNTCVGYVVFYGQVCDGYVVFYE